MRLLPLGLLSSAVLTSGCAGLPEPRSVSCADAKRPEIFYSEDGRTAVTRLDVLTYNVEGLPKRLRGGRTEALREIGEHLKALRASGAAPDIVLFQEVFSRSARRAVVASGYPSLAPGPSARDPRPQAAQSSLPGRRNPRKGEIGIKLVSSGVVIAAEFPVVASDKQPFARGSCAGFDCLSNKGVAFARVAVPGVPGTIDMFSTHMNSMGASRVPERRHLAAHKKQTREALGFVHARGDLRTPTIFGGDFNMRRSQERFAEFSRWKPLTLVHRYCLEQPSICDVRMSWDGDAPWMDTQDLQLFRSGALVKVRPLKVEAMFDGGQGGPRLSDHDGFRVVYELSWPADATSTSPCSTAPASLSSSG